MLKEISNITPSTHKNIEKIRLFEAFAGIGSQLQSLKEICAEKGCEVESVGKIDWFVHAIVAYQCLHHGYQPKSILTKEEMVDKLKCFSFSTDSKTTNTNFLKKIKESVLQEIFPYLWNFVNNEGNFTDIFTCKLIPKNIHIFTYSFPCQDISSQGKQMGFKKGTRSSLLFEIERILKDNLNNLPKTLLMENVVNLVNKKFINDLNKWIRILKKLGYKNEYKVLNSADYGSPQHRKRVFLVSWLDKSKKFTWPEKTKNIATLKNIVDFDWKDDELNFLSLNNLSEFKKTINGINKATLSNYTSFNSENFVYACDGFGPTLTATGANSKIKIFLEQEQKIRYLNSMECGQYMGFNKNSLKNLERIKFLNKNKLIFLFGNSISVEMLKSIFNSMIHSFFT